MGDNECNQTGYSAEDGLVSMSREDLLRQVHPASGASSDTGSYCRSKGTFRGFPSCPGVCILISIQRPEQNETSLAVVPRNHALLTFPNLEAEASGLLDRLLDVFQEETRYGTHSILLLPPTDQTSDALLVNATLNCLAPLIRTRQSIANKIINAVLDFYPAKHVRPPFTPTVRVSVKSMERTARALLVNVMRKYDTSSSFPHSFLSSRLIRTSRNPNHPMLGKMQVYIERLMQSRLEAVDDASRKRGLPIEPTDGLDNAKRARLDAMTPPLLNVPPLPPGPTSYAQLFTLTQDVGLSTFDVKQLPPDLLVKIVVPLLAHVNQSMLTQAVDVCESYERFNAMPAN